MRPGGLCLVIDLAVARLGDPRVNSYAQVLKLGALREDVSCIPLLGWVFESLSLSHSTGPFLPGGFVPLLSPGPQSRARRRFERALTEHRAGRHASAFVQLGRAAHLLIDMACPVHAQRVAHLDDAFEWYVEGNAPALSQLAAVPAPEARGVEALVTSLARHAQRFEPDLSHHPLGRLWRWLGLAPSKPRTGVREQAQALIPLAAAHLASLIQEFLLEIQPR